MRRSGLAIVALALAGCGGGQAASKLAPEAQQALCNGLLPQLNGEFACRMDELADPTRALSEPVYDVTGEVAFKPSGVVSSFSGLRASGAAANPNGTPADCAVAAIRHLRVPAQPEPLNLKVQVRWREAGEYATLLVDGTCALTVAAKGP